MDKESKTLEKTGNKIVIRLKKLLNEKYIDPEDAGPSINMALDELQSALKRVRNPEKWAEKYHRSLPGVLDMIDRLTNIFGKMK